MDKYMDYSKKTFLQLVSGMATAFFVKLAFLFIFGAVEKIIAKDIGMAVISSILAILMIIIVVKKCSKKKHD